MIQIETKAHPLIFKKPSGTSRGILTEKPTWYITARADDGTTGIGECSLIPGLSPDDETHLQKVMQDCTRIGFAGLDEMQAFETELTHLPALRFALETARMDLENGGTKTLFPSPFTRGADGISINGLIWMADKANMTRQVKTKLNEGYTCIKLKIGAIDFDAELEVLRFIRNQFTSNDIEIRVDANGAFAPDEALEKLKRLADFDLHSIEQPIAVNQYEAHARLCEETPLPIALDEELIGLQTREERITCLETIKPQYIILKPSLVGGLASAKEWIDLAAERGIPSWNTSALESNIGLNAIAQWTYSLGTTMPQGLGTGQLFTNNPTSPLYIEKGFLRVNPSTAWEAV